MIPLILTFGCIFFLGVGVGIASWGMTDIQCEGPDINNIITSLAGVGIIIFGFFSVDTAIKYYHEKESPKTEIITTIPAQIDTTVTIKNGVADTLYTCHLIKEE